MLRAFSAEEKMALAILHLFAGILYFYALWYDQKYVEVNYVDGLDGYPFKNRVLLLTFWTLALQALYMTTAFLNDVIGTNEVSPRKPPAIRQIKDTIFGLAYPSAIYVSIAFWGIYHVQKDLIYPEHIERAYPPWLNHVMHTITAVLINIEMFTANIDYPSKTINLFIGHVYMISYLIWIFIVFAQTGLWPYAVLIHVNWPTRLVLIFGSLILGNVFNVFGWTLNRKLACKVKST